MFLFATFFSLVFSLCVLLIKSSDIFLYTEIYNVALYILPGLLNAVGFFMYLKSLKIEESSVVVALFQLSPVIAYFLAHFFLGESLTVIQVVASVCIILGAIILAIDLEDKDRISFKKEVLFFVFSSAFLFALNDVIFKGTTLNEGSFIVSLFWQHVGIFLVGLLFYIFSTSYREEFVFLIKRGRKKFFILNSISEIFYVLGNLLSNFATFLAPVALVLVVNSFQAVFVFIIGVIFTIFWPRFVNEKISRKYILQKIIAIIIIIIGSFLLYLN